MPKLSKSLSLYSSPDETGPTFELVTVTTALAEEWLGKNHSNRNVRAAKVASYARDMIAGRWHLTGESIKFDYNGRLIDGQHRLRALIEAARPVTMLVARGLDPESQEVIDTGAKRSAGDALKMYGERSHPNVVAAAIRLAIGRENGVVKNSSSTLPDVSHSEVIAWYEKNPDISHAVAMGAKVAKAIGTSPSVVSYAIYLTHQVDSAAAFQFFDDLANMRTQGKGDPKYTLLRRLDSIRSRQEKANSAQILYYILRAWNAWRDGDPLHGLKDSAVGTATKIQDPR